MIIEMIFKKLNSFLLEELMRYFSWKMLVPSKDNLNIKLFYIHR